MFLPYERQITELLQELMHFRAVAVRSQQEKARYAEELNETCQEIEQALYGWANDKLLYSGNGKPSVMGIGAEF